MTDEEALNHPINRHAWALVRGIPVPEEELDPQAKHWVTLMRWLVDNRPELWKGQPGEWYQADQSVTRVETLRPAQALHLLLVEPGEREVRYRNLPEILEQKDAEKAAGMLLQELQDNLVALQPAED